MEEGGEGERERKVIQEVQFSVRTGSGRSKTERKQPLLVRAAMFK